MKNKISEIRKTELVVVGCFGIGIAYGGITGKKVVVLRKPCRQVYVAYVEKMLELVVLSLSRKLGFS